jgi:hypothetical protein
MKNVNISQIDTIFSNGSYPIEFLLYYQEKIKTGKIRSALKKLVSDFWPLFGEYDDGKICFKKYTETNCFEEQIINGDFCTDESPDHIYDKYYRINPNDPNKMFHLSILQFNNGTVLIPKMNHLAGDGFSYFYFLSVLAAVSREASIPFKKYFIRSLYKPHHQRTILKKFRFEDIGLKPLPAAEKFRIETEELSKTAIRDIIKQVAVETGLQVSTNDILTTMVLKKSVENQADLPGQNFQLTIPIDVRGKLKEYGSKFFGNGIMLHQLDNQIVDIQKSGLPELAVRIRKSMPEINREYYLNYLTELENRIADKKTEKLKPFDPNQGCLVTNLSRLPSNKLNFGSGNPDFIFLLTVEKNSAAILGDKENFIIRLVY